MEIIYSKGVKNEMDRVNYYKIKCIALESFYCWIDQGSPYDIAVEQAMYYGYSMNELEEIITLITIATRFERSGKEITKSFETKLVEAIVRYDSLDLNQYNISEEEQHSLENSIEEIRKMLETIRR